MKAFFAIAIVLIFNTVLAQPPGKVSSQVVMVIHGGAGTILKSQMSAEKEEAYTKALEESLKTGYSILKNGGTSLDAVEASIKILEDNPLFNAGKGAVFTAEGKNELDAAIMDGQLLAAGAVAGVTTIRNPISAARKVMEKSPHVMLVGRGAEIFAEQQGVTIVDPSYFFTQDRWNSLQNIKKQDSIKTGRQPVQKQQAVQQSSNKDSKYGTVGAVALDRYGNLAAGTSTGGMTNKKFGRVGDAPIIGAGTYANNSTCAISCTGWGEYFIRLVMAKTISDMMEFGKLSLKDAAYEMVMKRLPEMKGDGGLIAVDKNGNITMPFCTEGMYRGYIDGSGKMGVKIYKD